jgi:hypothetical protein
MTDNAAIIADLARAKVAFQLRTIAAVLASPVSEAKVTPKGGKK